MVPRAWTRCSCARLAVQGGFDPFENGSLPDAFDRRGTHAQIVLDLLVGQALVGLRKDLGTLQLHPGNAVSVNDLFQARTFIFGEVEEQRFISEDEIHLGSGGKRNHPSTPWRPGTGGDRAEKRGAAAGRTVDGPGSHAFCMGRYVPEWSPPPRFDGYELMRCIGQGGMGQVHLARDTVLDRAVAVKFLLAADPRAEDRRRFLVEARAIARLQHPNVVSIYRIGQVDGFPYIVSEFVEGRSLDRIPRPVRWQQALQIGAGIARALAAAHQRGVVHRDIKPANVILAEDGEVKLLDFGIAKLLEGESSQHALAAAAPEDSSSAPAPASLDATRARRLVPPTPAVRASEMPTRRDLAASPVGVSSRAPIPQFLEATRRERAATSQPTGPSSPGAAERLHAPPPADEVQDVSDQRSLDGQRPQPVADLSLTRPGVLLGTPAYMAPELWRGEPAGFAADIYAFGALMFALCTGHPPHRSSTLGGLRDAIMTARAPLLHTQAPSVDRRFAAIVDRCLEPDPELRFASANELREALAQLTPEARSQVLPEGNPYRGLMSFEAEHCGLYFGRDSETRALLERVKTESLVVVAGDSGVGKSSLVRAGVLSRLARWMPDGRTWTSITLAPGQRPATALASLLSCCTSRPDGELLDLLMNDPAGLVRLLRATLGTDRGLLLMIDQLEELCTIADPEEANAVAELIAWMALPSPSLRVLGTVRSDLLSRVALLPRLGELLTKVLYFLRPLTRERLRDAVVGPARAKGVEFKPESLVDVLVDQTVAEDGALPLLEFALSELWDSRRTPSRITEGDLQKTGGVHGALSRHAENVLRSLPAAQQQQARRILVMLVSRAGTRSQRSDADLGADQPQVRATIDALVAGRLLVARSAADGAVYQLTHEALIRSWPTLASWLSTDVEKRALRLRLQAAVEDWNASGRPAELLWRGRQMQSVIHLLSDELAGEHLAFVSASRSAARRSAILRVGALATLPLVALLVLAGSRLRNQMELQRRIDTDMSAVRAGMADASPRLLAVARDAAAAHAAFDRRNSKEGERRWASANRESRAAEALLLQTGERLEASLSLAPGRADVRAALADVLLSRARLAEWRHATAETQELLHRMSIHDSDSARWREWTAPATFTLRVEPAPAHVRVGRYEIDPAGRLVCTPLPEQPDCISGCILRPGSYCADLAAANHVEARLPFVLDRGERKTLTVRLPPVRERPDGHVFVPAGDFLFGSAAPDELRRDFFHTVPLHRVHLESFWIAKHETTFAQWIAWLEELPEAERTRRLPRVTSGGFQGALQLHRSPDGKWRLSLQPTTRPFHTAAGESIEYPSRTTLVRQDWLKMPVVGISANDAEAYAAWMASTGRLPGARLCTEHEWEKAARGADGREFPHGTTLEATDANFDATYGKVPEAMGPDEVGSHPASLSPFGVHDMAGNVWEWTRSSLAADEFAARGGSWYFGMNSSRATDREVTEPSFRDLTVGVRLCADAR